MNKKIFASLLVALALAITSPVQAQAGKPFRVGIVHEGGEYTKIVDGLKEALREQGHEPGKDILLDIRAVKGDRRAAAESARSLEKADVDLIYSLGTSVTVVVKGATAKVPIVFVIGGDAVASGLVDNLARPSGRLTGIQYLSVELTGKRLEILKEVLPNLHKIATIYDQSNRVGGIEMTREAARQLNVDVVERPVATVADLRRAFTALSVDDAQAYFYTSDAMARSQTKFIIEAARAKKLPTMLADPALVEQGASIAYGVDFHDLGRLSAGYILRVLAGANGERLPIESFSRIGLGVNLRTARELGITVPPSVLLRADKIVK